MLIIAILILIMLVIIAILLLLILMKNRTNDSPTYSRRIGGTRSTYPILPGVSYGCPEGSIPYPGPQGTFGCWSPSGVEYTQQWIGYNA